MQVHGAEDAQQALVGQHANTAQWDAGDVVQRDTHRQVHANRRQTLVHGAQQPTHGIAVQQLWRVLRQREQVRDEVGSALLHLHQPQQPAS